MYPRSYSYSYHADIGASIRDKNAPGDTPLHFTCVKGFLDTALKTMCTKMIDLDKIDGPKHTRV